MKMCIAALAAAFAAQAQTSAGPGVFEGRRTIELANGVVRLSVLEQGAAMASVVLLDAVAPLNPLWDPARMSRELGQPPRQSPGTGHFICVDGFGASSAEEAAAGLQGHGEAHRMHFEIVRSQGGRGAAVLEMKALLPIVQERLTRTYRLAEGENVVYVESRLESLLGFDRPVNWAEHATIGAPFLESGQTVVDISGSRSRARPWKEPASGPLRRRLKSGADFLWPMAPGLDGREIDLRETPRGRAWLDHAATLVDQSRPLAWATALHPGRRLILGYVFRGAEYPWLQYWGSYPPAGNFARGIEFSTQPFDVARREAVSMGSLFGAPTYRWLPAKSSIGSRFAMFWGRTPAGMRRVDEVRVEPGGISVVDRASGKTITFRADGAYLLPPRL